ncbi:securin [Protopterus annectens]|uniref:securin n=1 Tax=Protopterus annectens TaxID=7888 RepID=UPI001CF97D45|nr:securin [Protopterus annectens]
MSRIFVDQENGDVALNIGTSRMRLHSAPCMTGKIVEKSIRTLETEVFKPMTGPKKQQLGNVRKALGNINCHPNASRVKPEIPVSKAKSIQTSKVKPAETIPAVQEKVKGDCLEYPDIESFHPYDPLDFDTFNVPDEHRVSHLCFAGLSIPAGSEIDSLEEVSPMNFSPIKFTYPICQSDIDPLDVDVSSFLQTIDELIELPPLECGSP